MRVRLLLVIDAAINLILGVLLLLAWPCGEQLTRLLGVPPAEPSFYPSVLGAVLLGIGVALLIERQHVERGGPVGLGLGGAIAINLCGGIALAAWLFFGGLGLPLRGWILLGTLDALLIGISVAELLAGCSRQWCA
jgi:hypothetical protein